MLRCMYVFNLRVPATSQTVNIRCQPGIGALTTCICEITRLHVLACGRLATPTASNISNATRPALFAMGLDSGSQVQTNLRYGWETVVFATRYSGEGYLVFNLLFQAPAIGHARCATPESGPWLGTLVYSGTAHHQISLRCD